MNTILNYQKNTQDKEISFGNLYSKKVKESNKKIHRPDPKKDEVIPKIMEDIYGKNYLKEIVKEGNIKTRKRAKRRDNLEARFDFIEQELIQIQHRLGLLKHPDENFWYNIVGRNLITLTGIIYLLFISDSIGNLLPCYVRQMIEGSLHNKHIIAFAVLFSVSILSDTSYQNTPMWSLLTAGALGYILFMISTKSDSFLGKLGLSLILFLTLLMAGIDRYTYKFTINKNGTVTKQYSNIQNRHLYDKYLLRFLNWWPKITRDITFIIIIIFLLGFLMYLGRKKKQYKDNFRLYTFIFGDGQTCSYKNTIYNSKSFLTRLNYIKHIFD